MVVDEIKSLYDLVKQLRADLRDQPHGVNFNVVQYPDARDFDHIRIANVTSVIIHGFRCWVQQGPQSGQRHNYSEDTDIMLNKICHPSGTDIFGNTNVDYTIDVSDYGMWLYPTTEGKYYVLPSDYHGLRLSEIEYIGFSYTLDDGTRKTGQVQRVSKTTAVIKGNTVKIP